MLMRSRSCSGTTNCSKRHCGFQVLPCFRPGLSRQYPINMNPLNAECGVPSAECRAKRSVRHILMGAVAAILAMAGSALPSQAADSPSAVKVIDYHGWSNVVSVNNGVVETLVVPAIGRVLQFRFVGDTNGALWEDPTTLGQGLGGRGYKFFGGDRAWPSPQ